MNHEQLGKLQVVLRDPLTGLLNEKAFFQRLRASVQEARRLDKPCSVVAVEIDQFEKWRQKCGGGEESEIILQKVGSIIKNQIRKTDFATRYRHSNFLVALIGSRSGGARQVAERLIQKAEVERFRQGEVGSSVKISLFIGIACFQSLTQSAQDLVAGAEKALRSARKEESRIYFSP